VHISCSSWHLGELKNERKRKNMEARRRERERMSVWRGECKGKEKPDEGKDELAGERAEKKMGGK
jgi:hypothetical protein